MGKGLRIPYASNSNYLLLSANKKWHLNDAHFFTRGAYWTKFEVISSKIQMIKTTKKDSAGRNI